MIAHIFEEPGTYTVTLTTSNMGGQISQEMVQISSRLWRLADMAFREDDSRLRKGHGPEVRSTQAI